MRAPFEQDDQNYNLLRANGVVIFDTLTSEYTNIKFESKKENKSKSLYEFTTHAIDVKMKIS